MISEDEDRIVRYRRIDPRMKCGRCGRWMRNRPKPDTYAFRRPPPFASTCRDCPRFKVGYSLHLDECAPIHSFRRLVRVFHVPPPVLGSPGLLDETVEIIANLPLRRLVDVSEIDEAHAWWQKNHDRYDDRSHAIVDLSWRACAAFMAAWPWMRGSTAKATEAAETYLVAADAALEAGEEALAYELTTNAIYIRDLIR